MLKSAVLVNLALASVAFAGSYKQEMPVQQQQPTTIPVRQLDWNQFKVSCTNPAAFQSQLAPTNIRIACSETVVGWEQGAPGTKTLQGSRVVNTQVFSSKYNVAAQDSLVPVAPAVGQCPTFQQVERKLSTERAVTCDEILAFQGDLKDFCVNVLDEAKYQNAQLVSAPRYTGLVVDTCGNAPVAPVKGDERRQQQR